MSSHCHHSSCGKFTRLVTTVINKAIKIKLINNFNEIEVLQIAHGEFCECLGVGCLNCIVVCSSSRKPRAEKQRRRRRYDERRTKKKKKKKFDLVPCDFAIFCLTHPFWMGPLQHPWPMAFVASGIIYSSAYSMAQIFNDDQIVLQLSA